MSVFSLILPNEPNLQTVFTARDSLYGCLILEAAAHLSQSKLENLWLGVILLDNLFGNVQ